MKPAIAFCIGNKAVPFFILLSAIVHILTSRLREVIIIHKVIASVIRWININHFYLAEIVLT